MTISVRVWDRGQACSGALARIESTAMSTYVVPARFYDDHVSRDLPAGVEVKRTRNLVTVTLSPEEYSELLSDAHYYAGSAGELDRDMAGLVSSARATVRRLTAPAPTRVLPSGDTVRAYRAGEWS